jgi:sugar O-acyltransferase (sialic acid O-acetyltransferase NeuD family)
MAYMYLTYDSPHEVVAFAVDEPYLTSKRHQGLPVIPYQDLPRELPPHQCSMFIPVSYSHMNRLRAARFDQAKSWGYRFISYVSSKAVTWPGFACGDNCFILEGAIIQPFAHIGHDVVVMGGSHIGHHSVIKDHVTVTCHAVVCGRCTIESYCVVGANATIRDHIVLAEGTLVGAGTVILNDTDEWQMYKALPNSPAAIRSDLVRKI